MEQLSPAEVTLYMTIQNLERDLEAARQSAGSWRSLAHQIAAENRELREQLAPFVAEAVLAS